MSSRACLPPGLLLAPSTPFQSTPGPDDGHSGGNASWAALRSPRAGRMAAWRCGQSQLMAQVHTARAPKGSPGFMGSLGNMLCDGIDPKKNIHPLTRSHSHLTLPHTYILTETHTQSHTLKLSHSCLHPHSHGVLHLAPGVYGGPKPFRVSLIKNPCCFVNKE